MVHASAEKVLNGSTIELTRPAGGRQNSDCVQFGAHERQFVLLRTLRYMRQGDLEPADLVQLARLPPDPEVTAVVPARNEAATVGAVVQECARYAGQVLVVESGSTDGTAEIAQKAGARIVRDKGEGKGAAVRFALQHVSTPICVLLDADGSHDPIDIPLLALPIKAGVADHVTGSRLLGGSDELHGGLDEFLRLAGSAFITYAINRKYGVRLSDSQNGYRAIRTAVFNDLKLNSQHTTIEMEMIMATLAAGYRLAEVPTHERPRAAGFSKISLSHPRTWFSYGWTLLAGMCRRRRRTPRSGK